jgi:hypothetical protein
LRGGISFPDRLNRRGGGAAWWGSVAFSDVRVAAVQGAPQRSACGEFGALGRHLMVDP